MATTPTQTVKPKAKTSESTVTSVRPRTGFLAFVGGLVAALPLTFAAAIPLINAEVGASVAKADRTVNARTAADTLSCSQPTGTTSSAVGGAGGGGAGGGQVLGASTLVNPPTGGAGGGNSQTPAPFVQHVLGGNVTVNGSITGPTGPDSNNVVTSNVTETFNVTNNNNVNVSNSNNQTAKSGSAEVEGNTTGGSAVSGDAWNTNSTNLNVAVTN